MIQEFLDFDAEALHEPDTQVCHVCACACACAFACV